MFRKKQGMNTIISPSVIQLYEILFHPNSKILPTDKKSCVGVSVAYLPKAWINNYYHGVSVFWKNLRIKVVIQKTEGLVKWSIDYLINIKIMSCHMVSIYPKHNMTWQCQQCVHIQNRIMLYHIWNVCCVFVCNVHGLIF